MNSLLYALTALAIGPLVLLLVPLLTLIAVPLTIIAFFTAPLAIVILYSRVWLVYVDYFLALFYRALIRPNLNEGNNPYPSYNPGEIARRYNMRNQQQYRYPRGHPPTTPTDRPPTMYSPTRVRSRKSSHSEAGEGTNTLSGHQSHRTSPSRPPRTSMDADMDAVSAWEDLASIAQQHSHKRGRSTTAQLASAYL